MKTRTEKFDLVIDNHRVTVKATPFTLPTNETRYRVSVNESPVFIYAWNEDQQRYAVLESGKAAGHIPEQINEAIGQQLQQHSLAA